MSDVKQVKVDNWGIYFLQRLKHFFNRTDYCDLTLQFQDNAQLKVHRLVLSACTEYFELLERTCEMYEDCLVMPDDLQADVVVPIVNFMYTGHLEFPMDLLERLYQTSQVLNMPVLTKLLEAHRSVAPKAPLNYTKKIAKTEPVRIKKITTPTVTPSNKRSYSKAFDNNIAYTSKEKRVYVPGHKSDSINNSSTNVSYALSPPAPSEMLASTPASSKKQTLTDPRPTRYELPEELDTDNVFDNSFCNISYTSKPLMVHPETVKRYSSKRGGLFSEASGSRKVGGMPTLDIVECKRITKDDNIFVDSLPETINDDNDIFPAPYSDAMLKDDNMKDSSQLFDQILDQNTTGPKVTIETKDTKTASNIDHAKIISEVLKKYPHLVKSNKNIKLKIFNTPSNSKPKKQSKTSSSYVENKSPKLKSDVEGDFTFESDVLDSKEAAKLIAMGAENTKGPWICLICGTPGKALNFISYYKFRRHLVDVHNEKPVANICEYCGLRSLKRNYLLHHLYSQHGVPPPPQYNFPKCNRCNYIALTEGFLVKHKMTHKEVRNFRCNVCATTFDTSNKLLIHIQNTGHKYSADRKTNLQCIYCLKVFLRESNLYAHLKTHHKKEAKSDCIMEDSEDENTEHEKSVPNTITSKSHVQQKHQECSIKFEPSTSYDGDYEVDVQFQIQQRPDGDIQVVSRKSTQKQKILNAGFDTPKSTPTSKHVKNLSERNEFLEDVAIPVASTGHEEIVMIDNNEYVMRNNQLIPKQRMENDEYIISDMLDNASIQPTTSIDYNNMHSTVMDESVEESSMMIKKSNMGQPIQIVVSNEEEYKALMSSNHPIIFDNGDSNKTLTVLTAPHETTLEPTTIELDNTQSNDMMIIQDDYPLNVTEAVSANNSNIVVVYSHPVDDQNKQYQIITTQGIGAQFVQSSAMITQNYETVTTSTPVMSAHVLDTQVGGTWQNNVQNIETQQVQIPAEAELQSIIQPEQLNISSAEESSNLHETSLIPICEAPKEIPQEVQVNENVHNDSNEHIPQIPDKDFIPESHTVHEISMDISSEDVMEKERHIDEQVESTQVENSESEISPKDLNTTETIIVPINEETTDDNGNNSVLEEVISPKITTANDAINTNQKSVEIDNKATQKEDTTKQNDDNILVETQPSAIVQDIPSQVEDTNEDQEEAVIEPLNHSETVAVTSTPDDEPSQNDQNPPNKEAQEKIQNLTSEWSEDEDATGADAPNQDSVAAPTPAEEPQTSEEPAEIEESIENIRQEVEKHMSSMATQEMQEKVSTSKETSLPNLLENQSTTIEITNNSVTENDPQQKISSLLNDWEDNDSQEEATSINNESQEQGTPVNESKQIEKPTIAVVEPLPSDVPVADAPDPKNEIKKIVSDWDEEDEIKE